MGSENKVTNGDGLGKEVGYKIMWLIDGLWKQVDYHQYR